MKRLVRSVGPIILGSTMGLAVYLFAVAPTLFATQSDVADASEVFGAGWNGPGCYAYTTGGNSPDYCIQNCNVESGVKKWFLQGLGAVYFTEVACDKSVSTCCKRPDVTNNICIPQ